MPGPIQLTSVAALNLADFKDQNTGALQNGSIKLGKSTYSVKFTDGKVSVSRNFHLFNLFRTNKQNDLSDAFKAQMFNRAASKNEALYTNTIHALEKNFKGKEAKNLMLFGIGIEGNTNKQGLEALEKFKQIQSPSETEKLIPGNEQRQNQQVDPNLPKPVQSSKIESFIELAGLTEEQLKENLLGSLKQLSDPTYVAKRENSMDKSIDQSLQKDWLQFLHQNANRVNIFKTLNQAIEDNKPFANKEGKLVGWGAMIEKYGVPKTLTSFLQKNMKGDLDVTQAMVGCFRGFLAYIDENVVSDPVGLLKMALSGPKVQLNPEQQNIFVDCLINAVQREVMKLGLEFCREKKIPVLFQWTDGTGKTVSSKELKNQWWSPEHALKQQPKFSPILQTAMRHAQRMQDEPGTSFKFVQVNGAAPE